MKAGKFLTCVLFLAGALEGQTPTHVHCPGSYPGDLTVITCRFTEAQRLEAFVNNSLTDQAILGAALSALVAQAQRSPHEWARTWEGYGQRVGVRYGQSATKGAVEFALGTLLREDPRHIRYVDDPQVLQAAEKSHQPIQARISKRIEHALIDSVTVRRNQADGLGSRMPAISRFAGAFASGYVGRYWYPPSATGPSDIAVRSASAFAGTFTSSFYNEFKPEVGRLLGSLLKRGKTK